MDENAEVTLVFTIREAKIILAGLQELQGKYCIPVINKLNEQVNAHFAKVTETEE